MNTHSLIKIMKYKRDNIKAHIPREVFDDVIEKLEDYEHVSERLYSAMREIYELNYRIGLLMLGRTEK